MQLIGASLVVFLVILVAFSPAFSGQFLNWGDSVAVTGNPLVRSLDWSSIASIFSGEAITQFHQYVPLALLSYSIEYQFAGLNPAVFHGTNVVLHGISAILVLCIVFQLSNNLSFSFLVALLFAVHPLRAESVAWVTGRKDMLSGAAYFAALLAYILYLQRSRKKSLLLLTGVFFLLSLLSKAMAVSFPVVMMLVDYLRGRSIDKQSVLEKVPFFVLSIVFGIIALAAQAGGQQPAANFDISGFERIFLAGYGVIFYIVKFFVPINLSILHELPVTDAGNLLWYVYGTPLLVLSGIAALVFFRRTVPMLMFGGLFFLVTLAPVSQAVPVGVVTIAERFTYIPLFGLALLVASGLLLVRDHLLKPRGTSESASGVIFVAWIIFLASQTIGQTRIWMNDITLWTSVIDQSSPPALAYLQRGLAHDAALRPREAAEDYTRAIQRDSSLARAWNNRGTVFAGVGNYDQAIADFERAIAVAPSYTDPYVNQGRALMLQMKFSESIAMYGRALELDTANALVHYYRGQAYLNLGKLDSALVDYNRALELNPAFTEAYVRRGDIFFQEQKYKEAIDDYTEGIDRGASHELLFTNRGSSYANLGDFDRAIEDFNKALELNPNYVDALLNRGIAFIAKKDFELALVHFNILENMGHPQDPKVMKFLREQAAAQDRKPK